MKCSDRGITLIKQFEGCRVEVYDDIGQKPTIGYGHLCKAGERFSRLTESEATSLLCSDLISAEACIEDSLEVAVSQNQFDALVSLVFNIGCPAFAGSTLLRLLNLGDYGGAADQFTRWDRVGRKEVDGLLRRRLAEQALFRLE